MSPSPEVPKQMDVTMRSVRPSRTLFMTPSVTATLPMLVAGASVRPRRSAGKAGPFYLAEVIDSAVVYDNNLYPNVVLPNEPTRPLSGNLARDNVLYHSEEYCCVWLFVVR